LYAEPAGGAALWQETQNVQTDSGGRYSVLLGSTKAEGLPGDIFASEQARWIGVQIERQAEQPRTLLVSAPYALKAGDAETLGGLPPSAFVLAAAMNNSSSSTAASKAATSYSSTSPLLPASTVTTTGGTVNTVPLFTTATNVQNSILTQTGTTALNVGGKLNLPALGAATATAGKNSQPGDFVASAFNSTSKKAIAQTFQLQAEPAANNTATPSGTLNLLFASGTAVPAETGFKISSKGLITFAAGQTFPGTGPGTIKGVTAGTGLSGGGTTGVVTLNNTGILGLTAGLGIAIGSGQTPTVSVNSAVPLLAANNAFTGINTFSSLVGVGTLSPGAQLEADSLAAGRSGILAIGFSAPSGSNQNGSDALTTFGGAGDPGTFQGNGGNGLVANGGDGASIPGTGVIANGGFGVGTGVGGTGILATGVGEPNGDGSGGGFVGGNFGGFGDGIDVSAGSGLAGNFTGNLNVTGSITAGVKDFKIDHPLDPGNKYLVHASVESSEMMNIYTGNVTTDADGNAAVRLPEWFEALNSDFRYQLTVIGQFAQAIVGREIQNHEFSIRTNAPNVKVSWQVTAVRHDAFAKAHPLVVEEEKDARLKGFYIHPDLYGAAAEKQVEWARHPGMMKRLKEQQIRQQELAQERLVKRAAK
jgi:hypothetical protein